MDGAWGEHEIDYILFTRATVDLSPNPEEVFILIYIYRYIAIRLHLVLNVSSSWCIKLPHTVVNDIKNRSL
jgi:isopentenyldiphosphate isomerase